MATAYIGLGANLGNREANLRMGLQGLTRMARVNAVSSLYESQPEGPPQPTYYNAVCRIETGLEPAALLRFMKSLEHEIGRRPNGQVAAPRPIDLDLLLYENRVIEEPALSVPHPRMLRRPFIMVPLAELDAELPIGGETAAGKASGWDAGLVLLREAGWDGVVDNPQDVRL